MDRWLDRGFYAFHTVLIAFNMTGWAWRRTRIPHLVVLTLTILSWTVLGVFFGWGYCPCTDWHFQVRRRMGLDVPESSFIQLLAKSFGLALDKRTVDLLAVVGLGAVVIATSTTWALEWRRRSKARPARDGSSGG